MILRATEKAIQGLLQAVMDDLVGLPGAIPVLLSDEAENKPQMPYIVVKCSDEEEQITPNSGIFRVDGELIFRSHTKETSPERRQAILDAINNFAYDSTAAKLSGVDNFHCHGHSAHHALYPTANGINIDGANTHCAFEGGSK